jgi:hypothetical protein
MFVLRLRTFWVGVLRLPADKPPANSLLWWEKHIFGGRKAEKTPIGAHNVRSQTPFR